VQDGCDAVLLIDYNVHVNVSGFVVDEVGLEQIFEYITSRDSVVGIATSYGLDDQGVGIRVPVGSRMFSSPNRPDRL
jgi:hypothetical protein